MQLQFRYWFLFYSPILFTRRFSDSACTDTFSSGVTAATVAPIHTGSEWLGGYKNEYAYEHQGGWEFIPRMCKLLATGLFSNL